MRSPRLPELTLFQGSKYPSRDGPLLTPTVQPGSTHPARPCLLWKSGWPTLLFPEGELTGEWRLRLAYSGSQFSFLFLSVSI